MAATNPPGTPISGASRGGGRRTVLGANGGWGTAPRATGCEAGYRHECPASQSPTTPRSSPDGQSRYQCGAAWSILLAYSGWGRVAAVADWSGADTASPPAISAGPVLVGDTPTAPGTRCGGVVAADGAAAPEDSAASEGSYSLAPADAGAASGGSCPVVPDYDPAPHLTGFAGPARSGFWGCCGCGGARSGSVGSGTVAYGAPDEVAGSGGGGVACSAGDAGSAGAAGAAGSGRGFGVDQSGSASVASVRSDSDGISAQYHHVGEH
jgi:hypothetical protein